MRTRLAAVSLFLTFVLMSSVFSATIYVLTGNNTLGAVSSVAPTNLILGQPITGITAGETLVGIDIRPQTQGLYALGVNATTNTGTLYYISPETGFAAAIGAPGQIAFTTDGVTAVDFPDPNVLGYGFDFNPAVDRIRVVAGNLNFRVNPNTGGPVDGDNGGAAGSVTGTNPDGPTNGGTTTVDAAAYTNNQPNAIATTLYTLDAVSKKLFIQNPPNVGTQTAAQVVTFNGNTLNFTTINGFDIPAGVNVSTNNAPVTTGSAFAALNVGGITGLYVINLVNAQATFLGNIGNGTTPVIGIAVRNNLGGGPAIALSVSGPNIVRFNTATPGTTTSVAVTGIVAGETLVGIDWRPQTGQLYAFGVNPTLNTATLYLLDPQAGAASIVGVASAISNPALDYPDPATATYGVDFNPVADRLRVTTTTGLNFRVNPNNGTLTFADAAINGDGSTGVGEVAYTNNFGRALGGAGTTVLYTLDAAQAKLHIQEPPNNGTQTSPLPLTLSNGGILTAVRGFDIPSSNAANPEAWIVASVTGIDTLYKLDLSTGAATVVGVTGTTFRGLVVFTTPIIAFNPPTGPIDFGSVSLGGTVTRTLTVSSAGSQIVSYSASANGQYSVTQNATGSLGAAKTIEFTLTAGTAGAAAGQLTVASSDPSMASVVYQLTGTVRNIPVIASAPTATPSTAGIGQTVQFNVVATHGDGTPLTFSWNIAGATLPGASPSLVFGAPGTYTATVTVTDGLGGVATGSVNVTVVAPVFGTGNDIDGDGFSDGYETAAGTSPINAADSPTGGAIPVIADLAEEKLIIKFNFAKTASDSIQFQGALPIPAGFSAANKTAFIDVGGVIQSVKLDAKGKPVKGNSSFKISIKSKKGVVAAQTAKYIVKLAKGDFDAQLADEGLLNADLKDASANVLVRVIFGGTVYQHLQAVKYTAKAGKGGIAK